MFNRSYILFMKQNKAVFYKYFKKFLTVIYKCINVTNATNLKLKQWKISWPQVTVNIIKLARHCLKNIKSCNIHSFKPSLFVEVGPTDPAQPGLLITIEQTSLNGLKFSKTWKLILTFPSHFWPAETSQLAQWKLVVLSVKNQAVNNIHVHIIQYKHKVNTCFMNVN